MQGGELSGKKATTDKKDLNTAFGLFTKTQSQNESVMKVRIPMNQPFD